MRYQHALWGVAFALLACCGCKKDEANAPPTIEILTPGDGSTVAVPDTLTATLRASDDVRVEQITLGLLDANGIPVIESVSAQHPVSGAAVRLELPIIDPALVSGTYTLVATASDGDASARTYRSINIVGVPLRLRAVLVVAATGPSTTTLSKIDSTGQWVQGPALTMDLARAAVSHRDQLLYVCGGVQGPLTAIAPDEWTTAWERPNQSAAGEPYFSALSFSADGRPYAATSEEVLRAYAPRTGAVELNAALPSGYRADQVLVAGGSLLCTAHHVASGAHQLLRYQQSSGVADGSTLLDLAPVALFQRTEDALLLFGNTDGHGVVEERPFDLGSGWRPRTWTQPIVAVAGLGSGVWAVALSDGSVERFTYANASSLAFAAVPDVSTLAYDDLNGTLFAGAGPQVLALDPGDGQVVATFSVGGEVRAVLPFYNR